MPDPGDPGNAAPEGPWLRHGARSPPVLPPLRGAGGSGYGTARPGPAVGHRSPGGDEGKPGGCEAIRVWGSQWGLDGWAGRMGVPNEAGAGGCRIRVPAREGGAGLWNGGPK